VKPARAGFFFIKYILSMKHGVYIGIGGFMAGVLWRSLFDIGISLSAFVVLMGGIIFLLSRILNGRPHILSVSVFIVCAGLGMLRFDITDLHQGSAFFEAHVGEHIVAEGVIVDEPDRRDNNTHYTVRTDSLFEDSVSEKMLLIADSYPAFHYGDRISFQGMLKKPEGFTTDDKRYFDYAGYLSKDGIFYESIFPTLTLISSGHGNFIKRNLFAVKNAFLSRVKRSIPEPQASLLGGLVVGAKQSLGEKLQADFRTTGIIHIVVLSGYNITIVADAIMRSFAFLPRAFSLSFGAGAIVLFALLTGASATIVRASIMALLVILARATGRTYDITRALFIAGFLMVLHNPKILLFDTSFQLSFLATLGLLWLAPLIEKKVQFVTSRLQLREVIVATIATQIFVLPLLLFKMGELSLVSIPVNLLILITVPATMLLGFLTGVFGFVSTILALPFSYLAYFLLSYQLKVVDIFSNFPFASVHIQYFPLWLMCVFYIIYGAVLWRFYFQNTAQH
jgi:competence protein ComEC